MIRFSFCFALFLLLAVAFPFDSPAQVSENAPMKWTMVDVMYQEGEVIRENGVRYVRLVHHDGWEAMQNSGRF